MNTNIGATLFRLRSAADETQDQVSDAANVSRIAYFRYENDQREPKASIAIRLAQHFGVTVEYLYGVEDNPNIRPTSPGEGKLLEAFRALSSDKRNELLQYADFMLSRQTDEKGQTGTA